MQKIKRKIRVAPSKKFYELWIKQGTSPEKLHKTGMTMQQALKESSLIGYKNLWMDIIKKK
jgi:hypothetical protein